MTFRPPEDPKEARKQFNLRLPLSLLAYMAETAKARAITQTDILEEALRLDRDLSNRLADVWPEVREFAFDERLDLDRQLTEVLGRLIELGLKQRPNARKPKK